MKTISQRLFVFAGLLASPCATKIEPAAPVAQKPEDPRIVRLKRFLEERGCPVSKFAADFIEAADHFELDWRLLPSISYIESGGGRGYRGNNIFGWANGEYSFPSIRAAIRLVASRLGKSKLYRHKDLDGILRTYNPDETYGPRVKAIMTLLSAKRGAFAEESD